jgi:hypothetical protein
MGGSDSDEYVPIQDRNDSLYADKGKEPTAAPQNSMVRMESTMSSTLHVQRVVALAFCIT